jgi:hypothetical protein
MNKLLLIIPMLICGFILLVGLLFRIMHWPGNFLLQMIGAGGLVLGIIGFLLFGKKLK